MWLNMFYDIYEISITMFPLCEEWKIMSKDTTEATLKNIIESYKNENNQLRKEIDSLRETITAQADEIVKLRSVLEQL